MLKCLPTHHNCLTTPPCDLILSSASHIGTKTPQLSVRTFSMGTALVYLARLLSLSTEWAHPFPAWFLGPTGLRFEASQAEDLMSANCRTLVSFTSIKPSLTEAFIFVTYFFKSIQFIQINGNMLTNTVVLWGIADPPMMLVVDKTQTELDQTELIYGSEQRRESGLDSTAFLETVAKDGECSVGQSRVKMSRETGQWKNDFRYSGGGLMVWACFAVFESRRWSRLVTP